MTPVMAQLAQSRVYGHMRHPSRVAVAACLVAVAACQAAASPNPSIHPTTAPAPTTAGTAIPVSETAAPTGELLLPSRDRITEASIDTLITTADGFLASGTTSTFTSAILATGSADGLTWQGLGADDVFHHPLNGIATGPLGWVAAEWIDTPADVAGIGAVLWHSDDGQRWVRVPDQADLGTSFPGPVVAGPWGFAMLGQAVDSGGTSAPRAWVSRDGLAWRQMPPLGWMISSLVAINDGILAIGAEGSAITADGTAWVDLGPLPSGQLGEVVVAASMGSDVLAILTGTRGAFVWRGTVGGTPSKPTLTWQDANLNVAPDAVTLTALATGPLGALVLGFDRETLRPITWVSSDGWSWSRADLDEGAFGGGVPTLAAVGDHAFVVLGWYGNEGGNVVARPWTSTDGLRWEGSQPEQLGVLPGLPSGPCLADPTEAAQLIAMAGSYPTIPEAKWTFCFGDRELVLRGYVADCGGCGGETPYVGIPEWLLSPLGYAQFWLLGAPPSQEGGGLSISVQIDPRHPVSVPDVGAHVRVTGHFDDPAAQQCRLIPTIAGAALPPAGATIATCRHQFVVTAIKVLTD